MPCILLKKLSQFCQGMQGGGVPAPPPFPSSVLQEGEAEAFKVNFFSGAECQWGMGNLIHCCRLVKNDTFGALNIRNRGARITSTNDHQ